MRYEQSENSNGKSTVSASVQIAALFVICGRSPQIVESEKKSVFWKWMNYPWYLKNQLAVNNADKDSFSMKQKANTWYLVNHEKLF